MHEKLVNPMDKTLANLPWQSPLFGSLIALPTLLIFNLDNAVAQVIPDDTLGDESSIVNPRDAISDKIDGGAIRGQNLFHSFQEFNVDAGREVYFTNPDAITNIFSRVTGINVSNILGTLGVDGAANLFFLNPNGILFGEDASLDVQGSFTATTANGIRFGEQGDFDTINPQPPQLLTINPSAYLFNQIANQDINAIQSQGFLAVPEGKNLVLLGGDIELIGSILTAPGGRIELGGLRGTSDVGIIEEGSLTFPDGVIRGNISLSNGALVDVSSGGGGFINVNAQNLELLENSQIIGGIRQSLGNPDAVAGDLVIEVAEKFFLNNSFITDSLFQDAQGTAGNINIISKSIVVENGGQIYSLTVGKGNAGSVTIAARDSITFDGQNSAGLVSGAFSRVVSEAEGNAGDITITTRSMVLRDGARIDTSTFGRGDAGNLTVKASDSVELMGKGEFGQALSGFYAQVRENGEGNAKNLTIETPRLILRNGAQVNATTFGKGNAGNLTVRASEIQLVGTTADGQYPSALQVRVEPGGQGNAGNLKIEAERLIIRDGARVASDTTSEGNAGTLIIQTSESVEVLGRSAFGNSSLLTVSVNSGANGDGGELVLETKHLIIKNGGQISAFSFSEDAGELNIRATELIEVSGNNSGLITSVFGLGNAGQISLITKNLSIQNGGFMLTSAADVPTLFILLTNNFDLNDLLIAANFDPDNEEVIQLINNIINSNVETDFEQGDSGNIVIEATESINLANGSIFTSGIGDASGGNLSISTPNLTLQQGSIVTNTFGSGDSGTINIFDAELVEITDSTISSGTFINSQGNGGELNIFTDKLNIKERGFISTSTEGSGNAGNLNISTQNLNLSDEGVIRAISSGIGKAGNINLQVEDTINSNQSNIATAANQSSAGEITIDAEKIVLKKNSNISTFVLDGQGGGGNINITADSIIAFDDSDIFAFAQDGQGGNITLDTPAYFGENFTLDSLTSNPNNLEENARADINATGAVSGEVSVPDVSFIQNSLTELQNNAIDTDELVANSCVVQSQQNNGQFIISGTDSLPLRPGNAEMSEYPTGEVRSIPDNENSGWQPGDPIIEPQGVYRLTNGKLVLSRECN